MLLCLGWQLLPMMMSFMLCANQNSAMPLVSAYQGGLFTHICQFLPDCLAPCKEHIYRLLTAAFVQVLAGTRDGAPLPPVNQYHTTPRLFPCFLAAVRKALYAMCQPKPLEPINDSMVEVWKQVGARAPILSMHAST